LGSASTVVIEDVDVSDTLTERLQTLFASPQYRPPVLPTVAVQILELSQRPGVTFDEVVSVLEKDPLLAARVLSVSSSALYAGMTQVTSLRQASVRLGLKTLRDLVLEAAMNLRVFRVPGYEEPMERLRRHSSVTAQIARVVCKRSSVDAEHAFICGLLHDVGFAAGILALVENQKAGDRLAYEDMAPAVAAYHEEATAWVGKLWKLHPPILDVISRHHRLGPSAPPLVPVLIVAEQLAYELDAGIAPIAWPEGAQRDVPPPPPPGSADANPPEVLAEARKLLRIDDPTLEDLRAEALEVYLKMPDVKPPPKGGPAPAAGAPKKR
jgi:HD-like signal output (HDOD) protein